VPQFVRKITVVLADDHTFVRSGLRSIISRQEDMDVVGEAATGREAVDLCAALRPRVAVVDIAMPELNGLDAAAQIVQSQSGTNVVILSMHSDETYITRALTAGVKGYLLKDSAEADLVSAIRAAAEGRTFFSPKVSETLMQDYVRYLRQRQLQDSYDLLSPREREVLQLLAEGRTNKEVATKLDLSVTTVETHRNNLMHKLDLHSTAEIVLYAVRKKIIS
jgi:two-component system, NarL family, response regulator NreC